MNGTRRWCAAIVVATLGAAAPAVAQDPLREGIAGDERGAALYVALVENEALRSTAFAQVLGRLSEGLHDLSPLPPGLAPTSEVCAYLAGTGGSVPRLDGGGDLLNPISGPFEGTRLQTRAWTYRIDGFDDQGPAVVVVDAFRLDGLAVALQRYRAEGVTARLSDLDPLWHATVGYWLDLWGRDTGAPDVPHGHLVTYHLLSQLPPGTRVVEVRQRLDHRVDLVLQNPEFGRLRVHLVAMDYDDTTSIARALSETAAIGPAVVVMSWGIVPCDVAFRYQQHAVAAQYPTIVDFLVSALGTRADEFETLVRGLCVAFEEAMPGLVGVADAAACATVGSDVLLGLAPIVALAEFDVVARAALGFDPSFGQTYFAAAGNQGLAIPMPPAAWPDVVGVEACALGLAREPLDERAPFSNAGRTDRSQAVARALGGWFATREWRRDLSVPSRQAVLGYWGTSFAAPTAALRYLERPGLLGVHGPCR